MIKNNVMAFESTTLPDAGALLTREQLLDAYKAAEQRCLKLVFEANYSDSLRTYSLIKHLRSEAMRLDLLGDQKVRSLLDSLYELSSMLGIFINGFRGEHYTHSALRHVRCQNTILQNVALEHDGESVEIDFVVLAPHGVFAIESKFSNHDVFIDDRGFLCNGRMHDYSLSLCLQTKEHVLRKVIESTINRQLDIDAVKSVFVVANNNVRVTDEFGRYAVRQPFSLAFEIEDSNSGICAFTEDELACIASAIEERSADQLFPLATDLRAIEANLISVLTLFKATEKDAEREIAPQQTYFSKPKRKKQRKASAASFQEVTKVLLPCWAALAALAASFRGSALASKH